MYDEDVLVLLMWLFCIYDQVLFIIYHSDSKAGSLFLNRRASSVEYIS